MNRKKTLFLLIVYALLGVTLVVLGIVDVIDTFWSGMGSGLLCVGVVRFVQLLRLKKDDNYRQQVETEIKDERNRFLRNKAWAWTGYLFMLIAAIATILLRLFHQNTLSIFAGATLCLMLVLYWVCYLIVRKKY